LEKYNNELVKHCNQLREQSNELINIIKQLQNPKLSADLLKNLENSLKQRLESHLKQLVTDLNIENQAETIIENILPNLVQAVIEIKLKPLTERVIEKMSSVEQYQQNLAGLIQQVSSRL
jgi:glutamyl-tRNA reductase